MKDFGPNFYDWPDTVTDDFLSSVTFALGAHQEATGVCDRVDRQVEHPLQPVPNGSSKWASVIARRAR
ncbi:MULTISPECIES: hypothetical protein [Nocardia]|uniref:Uncharacterized protein n=1 Tax=Nocardia sputorum TaxID=2984338 RepID=A0ABN6U2K9_9NOCA|nr:hypothetical protein [Nocardia sputorum]BDT90825.1 hypothetical protein IFM12275_08010 [Nocardia sputorum]BDT99453.1 hypothetical protein IFM12276_24820 [Nocardia sputorum]